MDRTFDVVKVSNGRLEQKKNEENHCTSSTKGDFQQFGNSLEIYIYIYTSWGCIATSTQLHWKKITNCILWKQVHGPKLDMSLAFNNKGDGSQMGFEIKFENDICYNVKM